MRILVCGGRNIHEGRAVEYLKNLFFRSLITCVIQGEAPGADTAGKIFAIEKNIPFESYHADWKNLDVVPCVKRMSRDGGFYNAAAGAIRNEKMAREGNPDLVVAFPGGPGTKNMIDIAFRLGYTNILTIPEGWDLPFMNDEKGELNAIFG